MSQAVFSPRARRDIEEIWDYTAAKWNVKQAERYIRQSQAAIDAIAANPNLGRSCEAVRAGYRKFPTDSHLLFYRATKSGVEIIRILHARMDVEWNLDA